MLTVAGLHVPLIPFEEAAVNVGTVPFSQMVNVVPKTNVGVMFGVTVTVNVVGNAHRPAVGVKVYVAEAWLLTVAGLQVPVTALSEVPGNAGTVPFSQIVNAVPKLNVGVMFGLTVTVKVVGTAH